jgi:hypothetical protein
VRSQLTPNFFEESNATSGIHISTTVLSVHLLLNDRSRTKNQRIFYTTYSVVLLICLTISKAANARLGQLMWIDHRDFPGGPAAYWTANNDVWYNVLGASTDVFGNAMGDSLLVGILYSPFFPSVSSHVSFIDVTSSGIPNVSSSFLV